MPVVYGCGYGKAVMAGWVFLDITRRVEVKLMHAKLLLNHVTAIITTMLKIPHVRYCDVKSDDCLVDSHYSHCPL